MAVLQCPYCLEAYSAVETCMEHLKTCSKRPKEDQAQGEETPKPLDKMTKDELLRVAEEKGILVDPKATKAQILEAINQASPDPGQNGGEAPDPAQNGSPEGGE